MASSALPSFVLLTDVSNLQEFFLLTTADYFIYIGLHLKYCVESTTLRKPI